MIDGDPNAVLDISFSIPTSGQSRVPDLHKLGAHLLIGHSRPFLGSTNILD
jgi:hypothetical protein